MIKMKGLGLILALFLFLNGVSQQLPQVRMETSMGDIIVEIDTIHAPITAKNFLKHIKEGTFENSVFYRVVRLDNQPNNDVKIEVIQGGLFTAPRFEKIAPIAHEPTSITGIKHLDGTLSMARMQPGTASTEFFICVGDQPELDYGGKRNPDGKGFAAFGHVTEGMDVVRKIQHLKDEKQTQVEPVSILKMKILP